MIQRISNDFLHPIKQALTSFIYEHLGACICSPILPIIADSLHTPDLRLERVFPSQLGMVDDFFTVEGDRLITDHVQLKIQRATKEVIADMWAEESDLFGSSLIQAEGNGVDVFVSALGVLN